MSSSKKHSYLEKRVVDLAKAVDTVVKEDVTVQEALDSLHGKQIEEKIVYFYVVDEKHKLLGVIPTRKLLLCSSDTKISDIMEKSVIKLDADQTLHDAMEIFARHSLLALPIVDKEGILLGAVDVEMYMEESFDIADARRRADIFQMMGLSLEEEKKRSLFGDYRLRMPWILCNMFGGIFCAIISSLHELVLSRVLLLAMFIPLVLSLSESVSMQAMTHSIQFMRNPSKSSWRISFLRAFKEWKIVGLIAITSGVLVGLISLFWQEGLAPSLIIGFSILISVTISSSFGIALPIFLHKTALDPKVASGPVVLMIADVLTTTIYLSLATWLLL
jgi:magnesium transporter